MYGVKGLTDIWSLVTIGSKFIKITQNILDYAEIHLLTYH